jgi:predicted nucleotidyltransferase component of viral defense system
MLHLESVEPFTLGLLKSLMSRKYLEQFVLVGGTALALQIGHRKSVDLDMFTVSEIDTDALLENLQQDYSVQPKVRTQGSLISDIEGIKVDFIRFKYAFTYPIVEIDGIRLLSVKDIAPMKLDAITGRGSKKDFYDLYFLLERFTLPEILELYLQKYPHSTLFHVIKSLTWFEDADPQALPDVLEKKNTWAQVKKRIEKAVAKL